jgi:hypothetical protein
MRFRSTRNAKKQGAGKRGMLCAIALIIASAAVSSARADEGPNDCLGVDFDFKKPMAVAKIDDARVSFVKSAFDGASCPSDASSCRQKAYLVAGDLVLTGKTQGPYTCVSYTSLGARKANWTTGWIPSSALSSVAPMAAPGRSDWIGRWRRQSGDITISSGANGALRIEGLQLYQAAREVHNGVLDADARPAKGMLAFADGGGAFEETEGACLVRMQRIGALLLVEDNNMCGGVMVTFTGFYRRKN